MRPLLHIRRWLEEGVGGGGETAEEGGKREEGGGEATRASNGSRWSKSDDRSRGMDWCLPGWKKGPIDRSLLLGAAASHRKSAKTSSHAGRDENFYLSESIGRHPETLGRLYGQDGCARRRRRRRRMKR